MARKENDDVEVPGRGYTSDDVKAMPAEKPKRRGRRWGLMALVSIVLVPALLFGLWAFITTSMSYSTGERVGYVQKFSKKGWVCKTWEGEMAMSTVPGSAPQLFQFTVRDDAVARRIQELMRTEDGRLSISYEQKKGVPTSCFGETQYYVTEARGVGRPSGPGALPPGAPPTPTTSVGPPPAGTPPTPAPTPRP